MTYDEILTTVNVAFNEKVKKILKKSYNKTIDVQFGIYEDDGRLTGISGTQAKRLIETGNASIRGWVLDEAEARVAE